MSARMNTPSRIELTFHAALTGFCSDETMSVERVIEYAQQITKAVHGEEYTGKN